MHKKFNFRKMNYMYNVSTKMCNNHFSLFFIFEIWTIYPYILSFRNVIWFFYVIFIVLNVSGSLYIFFSIFLLKRKKIYILSCKMQNIEMHFISSTFILLNLQKCTLLLIILQIYSVVNSTYLLMECYFV